MLDFAKSKEHSPHWFKHVCRREFHRNLYFLWWLNTKVVNQVRNCDFHLGQSKPHSWNWDIIYKGAKAYYKMS